MQFQHHALHLRVVKAGHLDERVGLVQQGLHLRLAAVVVELRRQEGEVVATGDRGLHHVGVVAARQFNDQQMRQRFGSRPI